MKNDSYLSFPAAEDRPSLVYAHLCNTAGAVDFELNDLQHSREYSQIALDIRRRLLEEDSGELANTINNMGNVESAEGHLDAALKLFEEAEEIRSRHGDESAIPLAFTYLTKGRAYWLKGDFEEALDQLSKAESIAVRFDGRNSVTAAQYVSFTNTEFDLVPKNHSRLTGNSVHYVLGNLERSRNSLREAKCHYDECLNIFTQKLPMHIVTSCAFYKLGCIEASLGNIDRAKYVPHE